MHEPRDRNEIKERVGRRVAMAIKMVVFVAVGTVAFGFIVKYLWNWLTPPLFGWHTITFWQGLGLFLLSKILFGGFHRGGGHRGRWGRRMGQHWERMSPEEREKFRSGMRGCRSRFGSRHSEAEDPAGSTAAPQH